MYANVQAEQILRKGRAINLFLRFMTNQEEVDRLVEGISVVAWQVIKAMTLAMHNLQKVFARISYEVEESGLVIKLKNQ